LLASSSIRREVGYELDAALRNARFFPGMPLDLPVVLSSVAWPGHSHFRTRFLPGLWLALYLRWGFQDVLRFDYPADTFLWIGYSVYALLIGVLLFIISSRRIAALGTIRLTVCARWLLTCFHYCMDLVHGYNC
jgi:hypothetical protein